ncbi:MAG: hypothetical protein CSB01_02275 [Bacteroidia bacterium]|nr:MAG: hypothetical protein CSB01_02275 [Bacteroidia bacterium]
MEFKYLRNRNKILAEKRKKDQEKFEQEKTEEYYIKMGFFKDVIKTLSVAQEQGLISYEELESKGCTDMTNIIVIDEEVPEYYDRRYLLSATPITGNTPIDRDGLEITLKHYNSQISTTTNINALDFFYKRKNFSEVLDNLFQSLDDKF